MKTISAEMRRKLAAPIPDRYIKQLPGKGSADYCPHPIIRQYLLALTDAHKERVVREHITTDKDGKVTAVAMLVELEVCIEGQWLGPWTEWGQSTNASDAFKSAQSDAIKRLCAMHLGLGLGLWARDHFWLPAAIDREVSEAVLQVTDDRPAVDDGVESSDVPPPSSGTSDGEPPNTPPAAPPKPSDDELDARRKAREEAFGDGGPVKAPLSAATIKAWKATMRDMGIDGDLEHAALEGAFGDAAKGEDGAYSIKHADPDLIRATLQAFREGKTVDGRTYTKQQMREAFVAKGHKTLEARTS